MKKLSYPPTILNKIREVIRVRNNHAKDLFRTELFNVAQSIAANSDSLYHDNKSDILKRFPTCNYKEPKTKVNRSAIIFDLSLFTKSYTANENATFSDFAQSLIGRILYLSSNYLRCDIVADRYFQDSLKGNN